MKQSMLIGFGDSWAYGTGLAPEEKTYLDLLSNKVGTQSKNFAMPGSSIPHLLLQMREFINYDYQSIHRYTAIFFLTAQERDLFFSDQGTVENTPGPSIRIPERWKNYYTDLYSDCLANFRLNSTLLSLRQICLHYGIQDRYIFGWQTPELWPEIELDRFWAQGKNSVLDLFLGDDVDQKDRNIIFLKNNPDPYLLPSIPGHGSSGHPNQLGHAEIADCLHNWITAD
jgi:hypothetical protein